ncbi:UNVERIFIED_CONTAM: Pollen allergen Phl p 1 [Sesamum angustifolium]|uniref:Pollen allergen Phl p 1 n=1 Tax=Sesamum angustifolium TaxID=2727405 RepID=A0AAW2PTZ2_9LAMI
MTFKIDSGSNPNYLAFAIEHVHGDGDVASVEISASNSEGWMAMQPSWGATWKVGLPIGLKGPYSVRVTTIQSGRRLSHIKQFRPIGLLDNTIFQTLNKSLSTGVCALF